MNTRRCGLRQGLPCRLGYAPVPIPSGWWRTYVAGRDPGQHDPLRRLAAVGPISGSALSASMLSLTHRCPMVCWIWSRPLRNGTGSP